jgi:hypothetical protein
VKLEFTDDEIFIIGAALGELKHKTVAPLIASIAAQLDAQEPKPQPMPTMPSKAKRTSRVPVAG